MKADVNSIMLYTITLLISMVLLLFVGKLKLKNKISLLLSLCLVALPLAVLAGMRYGVGTDYFSYLRKFEYVQTFSWTQCFYQHETEILFALIIKATYAVTKSYEFIFFFVELLTLVVGLFAIYRIKDKIDILYSFFIYYILVYHQSYNIMRQTLAMSVVLLGLTYLIERSYKKYILVVVIASFIHTTALMCLVFLFVPIILRKNIEASRDKMIAKSNLNIKLMLFYLIILMSPIIEGQLLKIIININVFSSYVQYINSSAKIGIGTVVIATLMIAPVYMRGNRYASNNNKDEIGILKDTLLLYLPLSFVGYYASWASRLSAYPQMVLVLLLPMLFKKNVIRYTPILKIYYMIYLTGNFVYEFWFLNYHQTFPYTFLK